MAGGSFWDQFGDDSADFDFHIEYGDIPEDMHGIYRNTVMQSDDYFLYPQEDREYLAETFYEYFVVGAGFGSRVDQDEWLAQLGMDHDDFRWDVWGELYDSVHG